MDTRSLRQLDSARRQGGGGEHHEAEWGEDEQVESVERRADLARVYPPAAIARATRSQPPLLVL